MVREQEVLRGGSPLSVAVTVSVYSARSEWLRGDDERSSPEIGFKEKRSARGPRKVEHNFNMRKNTHPAFNHQERPFTDKRNGCF